MDATSILEQARSDRPPSEWNIWPLRRDFVRISAIKWAALGVIGLAMFIPVVLLTIPTDFENGDSFVRLFAMIMLILLATVAFGGLGIALHDVWRLTHAKDYWLIITPETFVKASPGRVTATPLEDIGGLTLKGVALPSGENTSIDAPMAQFPMTGRLIEFANVAGIRNVSRKKARGNPSLAYRDVRSNKVVVICADDSYEQMAAVYELLRERCAIREDQLRRASYPSSQA
ncbi:MAG: hypothetical protein KGO05_08745 [Chloroflexota bacterium]|nr:hypothetical protein [Chloroflexota bacterium]